MIAHAFTIDEEDAPAGETDRDDKQRPAERRSLQILRCLLTIEVLRSYRFPAPLETVHRDLCERMGDVWHRRTTYRDLQILELAGVVIGECRYGRRIDWRLAPLSTAAAHPLPVQTLLARHSVLTFAVGSGIHA